MQRLRNAAGSWRTSLWLRTDRCHIPLDTTWFKVEYLRRSHFPELRAINHKDWTSPNDENELEKVALRATEVCWEQKDEWSPILWGHDRKGSFTILEGNHRMTALSRSEDQAGVTLVALVGLSPHPCLWHRADGMTSAMPVRHSW